MRLSEIINNPFPNSLDRRILYHGTNTSFDSFRRDDHGIYVTPIRSWAIEHYGHNVIPIYANIKKIANISWDDPKSDYFYNRDYVAVAELLKELSAKGFNAVRFGGESESMVLFNDIEIANAETGKLM